MRYVWNHPQDTRQFKHSHCRIHRMKRTVPWKDSTMAHQVQYCLSRMTEYLLSIASRGLSNSKRDPFSRCWKEIRSLIVAKSFNTNPEVQFRNCVHPLQSGKHSSAQCPASETWALVRQCVIPWELSWWHAFYWRYNFMYKTTFTQQSWAGQSIKLAVLSIILQVSHVSWIKTEAS